jgi:Putative lumazine-binding
MTPDLDDHDGIMATVQAYIDGHNDHDLKKFKRAFHEDAWMLYIDHAGTLHKTPLDDKCLEEWVKHKDPSVELRVLSVHQMGDAASVALGWGTEWFDFHNLLKIDGEWKITNKTASHKSR